MADPFTHRWQGRTLGCSPPTELLQIANLLADLLERETGSRPAVDQQAEPRELMRLVQLLDLRLEPLRPLGQRSPPARLCSTDSASSSNKSAAATRTTHASHFGVFGASNGSPVA